MTFRPSSVVACSGVSAAARAGPTATTWAASRNSHAIRVILAFLLAAQSLSILPSSFRYDCSASLTFTPPKPRNPPSLAAFAARSATCISICL